MQNNHAVECVWWRRGVCTAPCRVGTPCASMQPHTTIEKLALYCIMSETANLQSLTNGAFKIKLNKRLR